MGKRLNISSYFLFVVLLLLPYLHYGQNKNNDSLSVVRKFIDSLEKKIDNNPENLIAPVDSLIRILNKNNSFSDLGYAYCLKGNINNHLGFERAKALRYYDSAIYFAGKVYDTDLLGIGYEGKATVYTNSGLYDSAEQYYKLAYNIVEKTHDSAFFYSVLKNRANLKAKQGSFDTATQMMFKCVDYYRSVNKPDALLFIYNSLGATFQKAGLYEQSLKYYSFALHYDSIAENVNFTPQILGNIGYLYTAMNKLDSALYYLNKSRELLDVKNDRRSYYYVILNLGNVYFAKNDYSRALQMFYDLYKSDFIKQNSLLKTATTLNIGACYIYLGNYDSARIFLDKGLKLSGKYKFPDFKVNAYYNKYKLDSAMGNWVSAIENFKKSLYLDDSIKNSKTIKEIENSRIASELKHEKELNNLLKKENLLTKELVKRKNIILIVESVLFVLVLLIIVQVYISNKKIKRLHNLLKSKNKMLSKQKLLLEEQNELKNKFFSIISHDMISPFNTILGLAEILKNDYDKISEEDKKQMIDLLYQVSQNTFMLLNNLLEWSRIQMDKIKPDFKNVDIADVGKKSCELYFPVAKQKNIEVKCYIPEKLISYTDEILVGNIINNLFNNAVKFTPSGGKIILKAVKEYNKIKICVSDTGIGIPKDKIDLLFKVGSDVVEPGTDNEKGTGLGLILCYDYVKLLGGEINVESTPGKGTSFCFTIPAEKK